MIEILWHKKKLSSLQVDNPWPADSQNLFTKSGNEKITHVQSGHNPVDEILHD